MISIKDKMKCCGCGACASVCPKQCINMIYDEEGFLYPKIDENKCVKCNMCTNVCPILQNSNKIYTKPKAYAAINIDEEIRMQSSSGGIFSLLANHVLCNNGVVFGATFSNDFMKINHIMIDNVNDIYKLRGSKYLQSEIYNIFFKIKELLKEKKIVLFSGTPCQIGALKSYLKSEYDNLICIDFICHGVPSQKVWKKYINYITNGNLANISTVSFRHKEHSWKNYSFKICYNDKSTYEDNAIENLYMKVFLSDVCLRPSCYKCAFKGVNRKSDITLADFWGIQNILPTMYDDKGTSLVIVHSDKGQKIFNQVTNLLLFQEVDIHEGIKHNPSMLKSAKKNFRRKKFFSNIDKLNFDILVKKYTKKNMSIKNLIYRIIIKIKRVISLIIKMNSDFLK